MGSYCSRYERMALMHGGTADSHTDCLFAVVSDHVAAEVMTPPQPFQST